MTPPSLYDAITAFNVNDLTTILLDTGVTDMPKNKEAKTRLWMSLIGDRERIERSYARLSSRERKALQVLQQDGGELRSSRFQAKLEDAGIVERKAAPRSPFDYKWTARQVSPVAAPNPSTFEQVLARLLLHGMVWPHGLSDGEAANTKLNFAGGRYIYIPEEVARHLPPPPPKAETVADIKHVVESSARICQRDIYLLWSAARETPLQTTASGTLRMSDLKRIAGQLLQPETIGTGTRETDYRRIFFLRRLLTAKGLLQESAGGITASPAPTFLSQPPAERVRESYLGWRDGAWWNELWATYASGTTRASGNQIDYAPQQVVQARRTIIEALARLAERAKTKQQVAESWVTFDELDGYLHDYEEDFLIQRGMVDSRSYYVPSNYSAYQYNTLGWMWENPTRDSEAQWRSVERVFIQTVLTEGLYWLGLVDLGYMQAVTMEGGKPPPEIAAVRFTDMGRWLFMGGPKPAVPEETGRVVLQPNFHVFAFDPISDSVLARLDGFATRLNAERAIEFEITQASVYRGQLAGQTVPEIKAWLEEVTGNPLPQNIARSMDEWHAAFERIVAHPKIAWLEVAKPSLADALMENPGLKKLVLKRVTPTGFLVRPGTVEALERALLAQEELPVRSADPAATLRGCLAVDEAGRIAFTVPVIGVHVAAQLQSFAEQTADGWCITPGSIRRASTAGKDAPTILAELGEMAEGGVPAALQASIKTWARHYGRATVQSVVLIQFRDQETFDDLRRDPELRGLLKPLKPQARLGLATVDPDQLEHALKLLEARGVEITAP